MDAKNPVKAPLLETIAAVVETVHRLRAPDGCPWDRAQTHQTLRRYLVEESHEVLEVIDQMPVQRPLESRRIQTHFKEELGDLLMQVLLHAEMASEVGAFDFADVAEGLNQKLISRHPHVFGEHKVDSADAAVQSWEKQKAAEKKSKGEATGETVSVLQGLPRSLPALQRAARVIEKVSAVGFQWADFNGPLEKTREELRELETEVRHYESTPKEDRAPIRDRVAAELGDLFFCLANLAHLMKINPEDALRGTLHRFEKRFRHVERGLAAEGKTPTQSNLPEMDRHWDEAKAREKKQVIGITGGVASGKTQVAQWLRQKGHLVIDADALSRELLAPGGAGHAPVLARFGTADRAALRKIIFADPEAKQALEGILHPLIWKESETRIRAASEQIVFYEAALLIETGRYRDFDALWVILSKRDHRRDRLINRDGISAELAEQMIDQQVSDEVRRNSATHLFENDGDLENLLDQIAQAEEALYKPKPLP